MAKQATLTTCYEYTELRDGRRPLLKLWLLLPRCGDGERAFLGVAGDMGHPGVELTTAATATYRAEAAGFAVTVQP